MAGAGDGREPDLELPSFFRRRRRTQPPQAQPQDAPHEAPHEARSVRAGSETPAPPTSDASTPAGGLRAVAGAKRVPPPRRPPPAPTPVTADRGPDMSYPEEPTAVLTTTRETGPETGPEAGPEASPETGPDTGVDGRRPRRRPTVRLPRLPAVPAAAVSGAVAGLVGVALGWAALQGCEAVRGVPSCGGGPGVLALLLVVLAEVVVGAALLRASGSPQPTGTSLVGVGLVVVLAMLTLPASAVATAAAAVVLPVATALTFVLAHVVATTVVDIEPGSR